MPVDYVTGVSMGSIIGGLYAVGYTTDELEALVLSTDWDEVFSDRIPRRRLDIEHKRWDSRYMVSLPIEDRRIQLPTGLIAGHNISRLFARLATPAQHSLDFTEFPIPFACVAADIGTGEAVVLDHGFLSEAMRASMSIPSAFAPVRIGDRLLVDGGLVRVLPAVDVRNLGADIIIGVDVGERPKTEDGLRSIIDMTRQSLTLLMATADDEQRVLCDILISPDVHDIPLHSFTKGQIFIDKGEEAARAVLPRLVQLADSLRRLASPEPRPKPHRTDVFHITDVSIDGLNRVPAGTVQDRLQINVPSRVTVSDIESGIDRVFNTQFFTSVSYAVEPGDGGSALTIRVTERQENLLRIGLRYDNRRKAMLLLNTTFKHVLTKGVTFSLDAILADEWGFDARFFAHLGLLRALGVRARADVWQRPFKVTEEGEWVATYDAIYSFGELALGSVFAAELSVITGLRGEYLDYRRDDDSPEFPDFNDTLVPVFGSVTLDTYDRTVFPSRGVYIDLVAEFADDNFGSDLSFQRYRLDQRAIIPVHSKVSVIQGLYLGATSGDNIPLVYEYSLGGFEELITAQSNKESSFFGLPFQACVGPHVQMIQAGFQFEFSTGKFAQVVWNAGNTFEEFSFDLSKNRYINGVGVVVGLTSILGPVKLAMATSEYDDFIAYISAGYWF
jgi:NTE family protein